MYKYDKFQKAHIGESDSAYLIFVGIGCEQGNLIAKPIHFAEDGDYYPYMVHEKDAIIGEHLEQEFSHWVRIYDNTMLVKEIEADHIKVYRAGSFGCIIQYYNDDSVAT